MEDLEDWVIVSDPVFPYLANQEGHEEVFLDIFSFLTIRDWLQIQLTCKKWRRIIQDNAFWRIQGFRFYTPNIGVYIEPPSSREEMGKTSALNLAPMATIGLYGDPQQVKTILNYWFSRDCKRVRTEFTWQEDDGRNYITFPKIPGVVKAKNTFYTFSLQVCSDPLWIPARSYCDAYIIPFQLPSNNNEQKAEKEGEEEAKVYTGEEWKQDDSAKNMREALEKWAAEQDVPLVVCMLGLNPDAQDEAPLDVRGMSDSSTTNTEMAESSLGLSSEEWNMQSTFMEASMTGSWCVLSEEMKGDWMMTISNQKSALIALVGLLDKVCGHNQGFGLVPGKSPSFFEPGQNASADFKARVKGHSVALLFVVTAVHFNVLSAFWAGYWGTVLYDIMTADIIVDKKRGPGD